MNSDFFKLVFNVKSPTPECKAVCAGYQSGVWRFEQMVEYIFDKYLLEFCLNHTEFHKVDGRYARRAVREAFKNVYEYRERRIKETGEEAKNTRGEFGEMLLHAIIQELHQVVPAISKVYYKDGPNEVVKGFDSVHVVVTDTEMELWLGEAKFYSDVKDGISVAIKSIEDHLKANYLRNEFAAISRKIDDNWPHAPKLKKLINPYASLDDIFDAICIPVLITYESDVLKNNKKIDENYLSEIRNELESHHKHFVKILSNRKNIDIKIQLFFLPMNEKDKLVKSIDDAILNGQK